MSVNYPAKKEPPAKPEAEPQPGSAPDPAKTMHSSWTVLKGIGLLILGVVALIILCVYIFRNFDFFPK